MSSDVESGKTFDAYKNTSLAFTLLLYLYQYQKSTKMPKKNEIKRVEVKALSHNLMNNECPWQTRQDKKKVRMVRVVVYYYTDSNGTIDNVSKECCAEHQDNAEQSLIDSYGLHH